MDNNTDKILDNTNADSLNQVKNTADNEGSSGAAAAADGASAEAVASSNTGKKSFLKSRHGRIAAGTLAICAVMTVGIMLSAMSVNDTQYAVTVDGQEVCSFESSSDAAEAVGIVTKDFAPEGSDVKAVTADSFAVEAVKDKAKSEDKSELTPEEAAGKIKTALTDDSSKAELKVASNATEVRDFTPEPEYKKDETMLAGQARVEEEAEDGQKEVKISYVTVNGDITDQKETDGKVLKEGKSAVIYKGTRGLPEGADWKTFEGDPISVIGGGLGETALSHLGVPYSKWDCVDLVRNVYREMGIILPRSHKGIKNFGVGVSYANAKKGDIICYKAHVGIYLGDGKMVHSTSSAGGVHVGKVNTKKIVTVRRYVAD